MAWGTGAGRAVAALLAAGMLPGCGGSVVKFVDLEDTDATGPVGRDSDAPDTDPADSGAADTSPDSDPPVDTDPPLGLPPGTRFDATCAAPGNGREDTCGGLAEAWTKTAVNLGYYPYVLRRAADVLQCDGEVVETLAPGQGFAVQSTRNPSCSDNPPLRPAVDGYVFGYARGSSRWGWVPADALGFSGYEAGLPCADGVGDVAFQVVANPYDACTPLVCDAPTTCGAVNDPSDGDADCGGAGASDARLVGPSDAPLRYAPGGEPRRHVKQGDGVTVLYRSGEWFFVEVTATTCDVFTSVGSRGWMRSSEIVAP
ncbi:MAG: hypothetical protein H6732_03350 [Alphaproteobacteria bacterium]|nr:hypothetical protein [Alphaproteobacteria bacterium]